MFVIERCPLKEVSLYNFFYFLQNVKLTFEIVYEQLLRHNPTPAGNEYDWIITVRAQEYKNLDAFVEKVTFNFPDTFNDPVRGKFYYYSDYYVLL